LENQFFERLACQLRSEKLKNEKEKEEIGKAKEEVEKIVGCVEN